MDGLLNEQTSTGPGAQSVRGPLAFTCKMSLEETRTDQEEAQNDHKET